jgi:N-methylhydantoinase B
VKTRVDSITVDIIENALKNIKEEMDVTLFRSAMSPVIREQHDCFPMITNPDGNIEVEKGDQLLFVTGGSGGWGDPLSRDPEKVRLDVIRQLASIEKARESYGVILNPETFEIQKEQTEALRQDIRNSRGELKSFDYGNRDEIVANRRI